MGLVFVLFSHLIGEIPIKRLFQPSRHHAKCKRRFPRNLETTDFRKLNVRLTFHAGAVRVFYQLPIDNLKGPRHP